MTWAESTCRMRLPCGNIIVQPTWVQRLYIWSYKYHWLLSGPFSHLRPRRETMTRIAATGCRSNRCHDHITHNNIAAKQRSPCWESSAPWDQTAIIWSVLTLPFFGALKSTSFRICCNILMFFVLFRLQNIVESCWQTKTSHIILNFGVFCGGNSLVPHISIQNRFSSF